MFYFFWTLIQKADVLNFGRRHQSRLWTLCPAPQPSFFCHSWEKASVRFVFHKISCVPCTLIGMVMHACKVLPFAVLTMLLPKPISWHIVKTFQTTIIWPSFWCFVGVWLFLLVFWKFLKAFSRVLYLAMVVVVDPLGCGPLVIAWFRSLKKKSTT